MQLRIRHETSYRYDEPVKHSAQALRLTPRREPAARAELDTCTRRAGASSKSTRTATSCIC